MPIAVPYIPDSITVHMGLPSSSAANITVSFLEYVKNVASSEIYPTWETEALRANIIAIVSYVLNRVYTEFYRSRGYDFDITSTTAYDQAFVAGRSTFDNVDAQVDIFFNDYIRRQGFVEPLAAKFCNGTTTTCDGLSQWGSQDLAKQGFGYVQILENYYTDNIEIIYDTPEQGIEESYPGTPLRLGDTGRYVTFIQTELNRISQNYPAIPKVNPVDGIFGTNTEAAIRKFQEIFSLTVDGIVGRATWYELVRLYVGITRLSELNSEGRRFDDISWEYPDAITEGNTGIKVEHLQYMLAVVQRFTPVMPPVTVTGTFGPETKAAVEAFQQFVGLEPTGIVGAKTWDLLYNAFAGIENQVFNDVELFPFDDQVSEAVSVQDLQRQLNQVRQTLPAGNDPIAETGFIDRDTQRAIADFQTSSNLPATGRVDTATRTALAARADNARYALSTRMTQYPGYVMRLGRRDPSQEVSK